MNLKDPKLWEYQYRANIGRMFPSRLPIESNHGQASTR